MVANRLNHFKFLVKPVFVSAVQTLSMMNFAYCSKQTSGYSRLAPSNFDQNKSEKTLAKPRNGPPIKSGNGIRSVVSTEGTI